MCVAKARQLRTRCEVEADRHIAFSRSEAWGEHHHSEAANFSLRRFIRCVAEYIALGMKLRAVRSATIGIGRYEQPSVEDSTRFGMALRVDAYDARARKTLYLDSSDGVGAAPQMDLLTQELEAAARYRASVSESGRERVRGHRMTTHAIPTHAIHIPRWHSFS